MYISDFILHLWIDWKTMQKKVLIIGSQGQIGTELTTYLAARYGAENVIESDLNQKSISPCRFEKLDATDAQAVYELVKREQIECIYLLAAMLSATGETYPDKAWALNMNTLFICLNLAKEGHIKQLYWPSSIAVFGPSTPRVATPQFTVCEPTTVYGISKQAGERWCEWYHAKYGIDVRSLRYPGLISYTAAPGGGTTDYAVDIFHKAILDNAYCSFLSKDTELPMMYMPDAIRATVELMEAPAEKIKIRSSYNLAAFSFTPEQLAAEIRKYKPDFQISYKPDFRQQIADNWPASIDDSVARAQWGWKPEYSMESMSADMLKQLESIYATK